MSLQGFRRLIRSAQIAFKNDMSALKAAKIQLKSEFLKNKSISDVHEIQALLQGIDEVDEMLRFHIVQGSLNSRGNYGTLAKICR